MGLFITRCQTATLSRTHAGTANRNTLLYLHNRFTWYSTRIRIQHCIWVELCIRFQTSYFLGQVLHMRSCIIRITSKWFVSCCCLRPEYFNFGHEDGACRSSWRVWERYRRYCKLYRKSIIVFCSDLCQGGLQSCYVSSVYRSRYIWRSAKFVSPWTSNICLLCNSMKSWLNDLETQL